MSIPPALRLMAIAAIGLIYLRGYRELSSIDVLDAVAATRMARRIQAWAVAYTVLLCAMVPFFSRDLYLYIARGAEQAVFGLNPYVIPVAEIPGWKDHPMFVEHGWAGTAAPHGFLFMLLTRFVGHTAGQSFPIALVLFKVLAGVTFLATASLVLRLGNLLRLDRPWLSLYLFAWNPLLLLHHVGEGHNDLLFAALLLGAMIFSVRRPPRPAAALPLAALSALTKHASLPALPFLVTWSWTRRGRRATLGGVLAGAGLAAACAWPYVGQRGHFRIDDFITNVTHSRRSLHATLSAAGNLFGFHLSDWLLPALWCAFSVFWVWRVLRFTRRSRTLGAGELLHEVAVVLVVLVVLVIPKIQPWYLGLILPLALCLPEPSRLRRFVWALSLALLLVFMPIQRAESLVHYVLPILIALAWAFLGRSATIGDGIVTGEAKAPG